MRRFGEPVRKDQRYIRRPGAYAILLNGDEVLLTHQAEPIPEIQLPGGGIDPGESPLPALHREVMEETGWRIARPRRLGAFRRFVFMPEYNLWAEKLCHVYVAHPVSQIAEPTEANHETLVLSGAQAIDALGNDGDRQLLARYVSSRSG